MATMAKRKPDRPQPMHVGTPTERPDAQLSRDIQSKIGQQLRAMYEDILSQGVPDRFARLLDQLETAEKNKDQK
jgi:hypothetical protein